MKQFKYVFGPVPSRRLGYSLGINNIPYKVCSYSCIYCQLGKTIKYSVERKSYSDPESVRKEIEFVIGKEARIDILHLYPMESQH